jgi:hypothetical protein
LLQESFQFTKSKRLRVEFQWTNSFEQSFSIAKLSIAAQVIIDERGARMDQQTPDQTAASDPCPKASRPVSPSEIGFLPPLGYGATFSRYSFTVAEKIGDSVFVCRRIQISACMTASLLFPRVSRLNSCPTIIGAGARFPAHDGHLRSAISPLLGIAHGVATQRHRLGIDPGPAELPRDDICSHVCSHDAVISVDRSAVRSASDIRVVLPICPSRPRSFRRTGPGACPRWERNHRRWC